jgi:4-amino-4-deoxy-L-arabinose transferase-like glycosyltransferase
LSFRQQACRHPQTVEAARRRMTEAALPARWRVSIERAIASWLDRTNPQSAILILLALFVLAWTLFHTITFAAIGLHPDVTEMYGWGRHPMPGYYKHPPLGAWMCAAWFAVFPATDWSFHLMAMVNAAAALYFVDLIARRYLSGDKRLMVLLLLLLTPFYQFHARRFGANQALLATWPLATYCFLRAYETRALTWSITAGVAAALAMLGKYFSIYLIGGFIVAGLMHPARMAYLKSFSPWISAVAGLLVLSPHLYWLVSTGYQPFAYALAAHAPETSFAKTVLDVGAYLGGGIGYVVLPVAIYLLAVRPDRRTLADALWPADPNRRMLVILLAAFIILPALAGAFVGIRNPPLWTMQSWFLLPIVLLSPPTAELPRRAAVHVALGLMIVAGVAVIAVAPVLAWINFRDGMKDDRGYYRQLSDEVMRSWRARVGRPLAIVLGDGTLSAAVAFYSPDHPDSVPGFVPASAASPAAPWVTPARLAQEGWAVVCRTDDTNCAGQAAASASAPRASRHTVEIIPRFLGLSGAPLRFLIIVVPPQALACRDRSAAGARA